MPPETFNPEENKLIPDIQEINKELIQMHLIESSVYILGNFDDKFWADIVLTKPRESVIDSVDGFPILFFKNLTHFGVITIERKSEKEYYFGNSNLNPNGIYKNAVT